MYPTVNGTAERLRRSVSAWLRSLIVLLMCCGLVLQPGDLHRPSVMRNSWWWRAGGL